VKDFDLLLAAALSEPTSLEDVRNLFLGAWKLAHVTQRQRDALKLLCDTLRPRLKELDAQTLVGALWGMAKLGVRPSDEFVQAWAAEVTRQGLGFLRPSSLGSSIYALAKVRMMLPECHVVFANTFPARTRCTAGH
jgi:hypothetical protein